MKLLGNNMFIERIKIDFSNRKEIIPQIKRNVSFNTQRYNFQITKIIHDLENNELHLISVEWMNPNSFEKEDDIIYVIKENLDILIYDCLME